jgi:hypothetical protein
MKDIVMIMRKIINHLSLLFLAAVFLCTVNSRANALSVKLMNKTSETFDLNNYFCQPNSSATCPISSSATKIVITWHRKVGPWKSGSILVTSLAAHKNNSGVCCLNAIKKVGSLALIFITFDDDDTTACII